MLKRVSILSLLVCASALMHGVNGEDQGQSPPVTTTTTTDGESSSGGNNGAEGSSSTSNDGAKPTPPTQPKEKDTFNAQDHTDWGSYYDPQNVFCGKYDCYSILGFDYEEFGRTPPDTKVITKRYRSLSREWHPDKSKHKDAKERFVKIARAYEVLTDKQKRTEYDYMRYNQEAYFQTYGASVLWNYAPKSDATIIVIALFLAANAFTWFAQKSHWQKVADRLIKAACEDWSPSQGGSDESKHLREEALEILKEQKSTSEDSKATTTTSSPANSKKLNRKNSGASGKGKLSGKEKKQQEIEELKPIVTKLVYKMDDFGAGFHKPTYKDLFAVRCVKFPFYVGSGILWQSKYWIRRLQKKELNDEERSVLTERAVGNVAWDLASDDDRKEMILRELWIMENLVEWKEEQEVKTWSKADQKYYAKMKKQGKQL